MKTVRFFAPLILALAFAQSLDAQDRRPASPRGEASTQIGGMEGPWIVVDYGRPIVRGRDVFGSGDEYGQGISTDGVWRVGANKSTRLMTEADLMFGDQRLPAGEYSVFAELAETEWTLILSSWGAKDGGRQDDPDALWGSYGYTMDKDVLRTSMSVTTSEMSTDQMVILFADMTAEGGMFTIWWDDQLASTPFSLAK